MNFPRRGSENPAFQPTLDQLLFADTETIPTQRVDILTEMTEANAEACKEAIAAVEPPKSLKKQETIDAWMKNDYPEKVQAIREEHEAALKEQIHKTCLDGGLGQLVVISLAAGDEEPCNLWDSQWMHPGYESWLLSELNKALATRMRHHRGQTLVGHGIGFDRRMIRQRGIVLGIPVHPIFTRPVKPWENDVVFDTMTEWTGDACSYITQDKLCKALGISGKGSDLEDGEYIDGSMVWDFIQRGEIRKVAIYCGGDVIRARRLYRRMRGMDLPNPADYFNPGRRLVDTEDRLPQPMPAKRDAVAARADDGFDDGGPY
jgi:hypothetical protein